jgi:hypothetical protein
LKPIFDFTAGIAVTATAIAIPVVAAIQNQASKLIHMSGTDFYYSPRSTWLNAGRSRLLHHPKASPIAAPNLRGAKPPVGTRSIKGHRFLRGFR